MHESLTKFVLHLNDFEVFEVEIVVSSLPQETSSVIPSKKARQLDTREQRSCSSCFQTRSWHNIISREFGIEVWCSDKIRLRYSFQGVRV